MTIKRKVKIKKALTQHQGEIKMSEKTEAQAPLVPAAKMYVASDSAICGGCRL
jgi:hypothetical protein